MKKKRKNKLKYASKKKVQFVPNNKPKDYIPLMDVLKAFYDDMKEPPQMYTVPSTITSFKVGGNVIWTTQQYSKTIHDIKTMGDTMIFTNPLSYPKTYCGLSFLSLSEIDITYNGFEWFNVPNGCIKDIQPKEFFLNYKPIEINVTDWIHCIEKNSLTYPYSIQFLAEKNVNIQGIFLFYEHYIPMFFEMNKILLKGDVLNITDLSINIDNIVNPVKIPIINSYNDTSTKPTDIKIVKPKKNLKRNIIL